MTSGVEDKKIKRTSGKFGVRVFTREIMEKMLPNKVKKNLFNAMDGKENINEEYADTIAVAMKEWAVTNGATHYCHWFQPLTGITAEKHDSFIAWRTTDTVIERFNGQQLVQGEPDASSFPSGGLRSTYEARGYTGWDPTSYVFIWESGSGSTLFIPSVFFSWTGEVLDNKIPLLKSDAKIDSAVKRLLKLLKVEVSDVHAVLGWEQEYFVVDRALRDKRSDLVMLGRTLYGHSSAKGQDLQDHYFASVKDRILRYMKECEDSALELGIPVKTRHNEVAPAQHELACVHEKATRSVDHNLLMMEIMRQVAVKHGLSCLLQEKPFAGINGSGKHNNWSLVTDAGVNLFDPTDNPENSLQFLILLTATLHAVYNHATLLRASVGSLSNDERLGGHEAPPAIMSVYLGDALENMLSEIERSGSYKSKAHEKYDLGLPVIPPFPKANTDRNRTSPFAFTGDKFEFRAVGSAQSCAFPITILNVIVADAVNKMSDEIEQGLAKKGEQELVNVAMEVIRKYLKESRDIRFSGDSYTEDWAAEAEKRNLPNITCSLCAFEIFNDPKTIKVFDNVLNKDELHSRYDVEVERYCKNLDIKINLMLEMCLSQILPAAFKYQGDVSESVNRLGDVGFTASEAQRSIISFLEGAISKAIIETKKLETMHKQAYRSSGEEKKDFYSKHLPEQCNVLREVVDSLETVVDAKLWPLPKYWELLFLI